MSEYRKVIISGGGSGGHIYPAIAIADTIKKIEPRTEILFVGAKGKIEMEKVPLAGYQIVGLQISGFHRKKMWRNIGLPFRLIASLFRASQIIKKFNPHVVIGVGGFASGPVLQVAARMNIPTIIQEQNGYPGITNKLLAQKTKKICVAYKDMDRFFPIEKIVFTGNPVRKDLYFELPSKEMARKHFGIDSNKRTIFLFGGSLGAKSLNEATLEAYDQLKALDDVQVIWQTGKLYFDQYNSTKVSQLPHVKTLQFVDNMGLAYRAADIVVSRAGAVTISELTLVGLPAILVPSPNVAEDHQTKNAMALLEEEACILVKDQDVKENLWNTALKLVFDEPKKNKLKTGIKSLAQPKSAFLIADLALQYAYGKETIELKTDVK